MAEFEIAGMKFKGGKAAIVLTALSTLGGASWAGFEFYKDYMDMREIVSNIDVGVIEARNAVIETKLDEAIDYTRDIKNSLKDDIIRIIPQTPVRVFKLSYMQGESLIKLAQGVSTIKNIQLFRNN